MTAEDFSGRFCIGRHPSLPRLLGVSAFDLNLSIPSQEIPAEVHHGFTRKVTKPLRFSARSQTNDQPFRCET
jgi:hypothetical protein